MRDQLLRFINGRLSRYEQWHDASDVLDDKLRAAALELLELLGGRTTDTEAVTAAASVFWLRYRLLPEGQDEADLRQALALYRAIHAVRPEAVPDELRTAVLGDPEGPIIRVDAEQVYAAVAAYFAAAVEAANPERISACIQGFQHLLNMLSASHPLWREIAATLAVAHGSLYNFTSDTADLDAEIIILQSTVAAADLSESQRAFQYLFLGEALEKRYDRFQERIDLDVAIQARERSLSLTEAGDADFGARAYRLGKLLLARTDRSGSLADVDAAVEAFQAACSAEREGSERNTLFHALGDALLGRYNAAYRQADLEAAIVAYRTAFETSSASAARRLAHLLAMVHALQQRFALVGDVSDCETAVEMIQAAVADQPSTGILVTLSGPLLAGLGLALEERYLAVGDVDDLTAAAGAFRRAASSTSPEDPFRAQALSGLGHACSLLYRCTANEAHRAEAIWAYSAIAESGFADRSTRDEASTACDDLQLREDVSLPELVVRRGELAEEAAQSRRRYRAGRSINDLDRVITFTRLLLSLTDSADVNYVAHLVKLGEDLLERYGRAGRAADADEALTVAKHAGESATNPLSLAAAFCTEANAWRANYLVTRDPGALDKAVAAATRSVEVAPAEDLERAWSHNALGLSLLRRYETDFNIDDARRGADEFRKALAIVERDNPDRRLVLNNLAATLLSIYGHTRDLEPLNETIATLRMAVGGGKPSVAELANLGNAYLNRYYLTTDPADVDRARKAYGKALESLPASDKEYPTVVRGFFEAVISGQNPDPDSLREAVRAVDKLVEDYSPAEGMWHHRLGILLCETFRASGNLQALQRAVDAWRTAIEVTPSEDSERLRMLACLASALRDRYEKTHDAQDLDEAEALTRQCIAEVPSGGSLGIGLKILLKFILEFRLEAAPDMAVRAEVRQVASDISASTSAPPLVRAIGARDAAVIYAEGGHWRHAAEHFELAVSLLPLVAPDRELREGVRVLRPGRVAADGAACWLNAGVPERAAVLAELGRAVVISRASASRAELVRLREQWPGLADRFEQLRALLDRPAPAQSALGELWAEVEPPVDRATTAAEFDALLATIRGLPGHERFLLTPKVEDLLAAAADGPVILLNTSNYRCDALAFTVNGVRPVPLRDISLEEVVQRAAYIQMAIANFGNTNMPASEYEELQQYARNTPGWLWDNVVAPVLQEIGITRRPLTNHWPRIWWVPDGAFAWLPIHAAGHHDERHTSGAPTLLDRAQSSFIPSVSLLIHARSRCKEAMNRGKVLVVAMTKTPGHPDLLGVLAETDAIANLFPATILGTIPGAHGSATRHAITDELPSYPVAHFSCHASGDWTNPWRSFLAIQGDQPQSAYHAGTLSLADITSLDLQGQRLACLSACATVRPTELRLLDEALHLTSGFLLAGFTHVIGTLWEVVDQVAAEFMQEMYARLEASPRVADPSRAALAVHEATRLLREKYISTPTMWASYIYSGL
jgi:tetratricopeptide (TPR) repeat protein